MMCSLLRKNMCVLAQDLRHCCGMVCEAFCMQGPLDVALQTLSSDFHNKKVKMQLDGMKQPDVFQAVVPV